MANLVLGIGASHTTLMNTAWDRVDHLKRAHAFRNALIEASRELRTRQTDLALVVGTNHFRGNWLDLMPTFCLGVEEIHASGEHGTPSGPQKGLPHIARVLCEQLLADEFDVSFSTQMTIDHGISHAIQWLTKENEIPILPLMVNCFAPPLPSLTRCVKLGEAIRKVMLGLNDELNVAVIASGGLSHQLPFPDWREPTTENDRFLVDAWKFGRGDWEKYEAERRRIVVNAPPRLNEAFDREFLRSLCDGGVGEWLERFDEDALVRAAGNGANEIRTWLIMHAAMNYQQGEVLAYSPMPEWLTGMGVFVTN